MERITGRELVCFGVVWKGLSNCVYAVEVKFSFVLINERICLSVNFDCLSEKKLEEGEDQYCLFHVVCFVCFLILEMEYIFVLFKLKIFFFFLNTFFFMFFFFEIYKIYNFVQKKFAFCLFVGKYTFYLIILFIFLDYFLPYYVIKFLYYQL